MRIVLVDKDPDDERSVQRALTNIPHQLQTFRELGQALEVFRSSPSAAHVADLVLLDLRLPDGQGLSTLDRLLPHTKGIPVLVLADTESVNAGIEAVKRGVAEYLIKGPATFAALPRIIKHAVERTAWKQRVAHHDRLAMMGRITAALTHELANPAAFIALNQRLLAQRLERLKSTLDPDASAVVHECLEMLAENRLGLDRVRHLLRDMGQFATPDSVTAEDQVDLPKLVRSAARLMEKPLSPRVELRLELESVPPILGDRRRLHQVLTNLMINARDATPLDRQGAQVVVACRHVDGEVELEVRDNGVGIPDEVRARLFEPFFSTKGEQGTGLGLTLSAEIVRQHGGSIDIETELDKGSVFRLRFPDAGPPLVAERRAIVLVMDDDEDFLNSVRNLIDRMHDTRIAATVNEAKRELLDEEVDVILADVSMPDGGGVELHRHLESERTEMLDRLVFITGGRSNPDIRAFCRDTPNRVLYKPLSLPLLKHVINEVAGPVT